MPFMWWTVTPGYWQLRKSGSKGIMKILKQLSEESGIPYKTLYHWWRELEKEKSLKIQTNGEIPENTEETAQEEVVQVVPM